MNQFVERELFLIQEKISLIEKRSKEARIGYTFMLAKNLVSVLKEDLESYNALLRMQEIIESRFVERKRFEYLEEREKSGLEKISDFEYHCLLDPKYPATLELEKINKRKQEIISLYKNSKMPYTSMMASDHTFILKENIEAYEALVAMEKLIANKFNSKKYYDYMDFRIISGLGQLSDKDYELLVGINKNKKDYSYLFEDTIEVTTSKETMLLEMFDRFWNAYPKKGHKKNAFKCFQKLNPSEELLQKILIALENQKKVHLMSDFREASTYINQSMWEGLNIEASKKNTTPIPEVEIKQILEPKVEAKNIPKIDSDITYKLKSEEIIQDLPIYDKREQIFNTPGMSEEQVRAAQEKILGENNSQRLGQTEIIAENTNQNNGTNGTYPTGDTVDPDKRIIVAPPKDVVVIPQGPTPPGPTPPGLTPPIEDEEPVKVVSTTVWQWIKDHKKQILIALGITALTIATIVLITQLLPALMAAAQATQVAGLSSQMLSNGALWHTAIASEQAALHGANTALASAISSATGVANSFNTASGVWTLGSQALPAFAQSAAGAAASATAKAGLLKGVSTALGVGGFGLLGGGLLFKEKRSQKYLELNQKIKELKKNKKELSTEELTQKAKEISGEALSSESLSIEERKILLTKLNSLLKKTNVETVSIDIEQEMSRN